MASKSVYLCRECLKVFTYPTWCDDCCKCIECCRCLAWGRAESNPCERCGENEIVEPAPAGWCQECWDEILVEEVIEHTQGADDGE